MFKKMEKSFYYGFPVVLMTTKDEKKGFYMIQLISMWINGNLLSINSGNIQLPTSR